MKIRRKIATVYSAMTVKRANSRGYMREYKRGVVEILEFALCSANAGHSGRRAHGALSGKHSEDVP